jgi:uncharacterized protein (TIGR02453 family)
LDRAAALQLEESMSTFVGFRPQALTFFRQLARHNAKDWFEAHRADYEADVKQPMAELVEEVDVRLATIAPELIGDPKRSVFRIYRDIRFSNDKSPYKTHAACWFYHRDAGKGVGGDAGNGGAGYYFHLAADGSYSGGGIWMPPRPALNRIRDALAERHSELERELARPAFKRRFGALDEEGMLKRVPRGFAPDHPAAPLLRHQSFTTGRRLSEREVLSTKLPDLLARDYALMLPLVRWLNAALGHRTAARR